MCVPSGRVQQQHRCCQLATLSLRTRVRQWPAYGVHLAWSSEQLLPAARRHTQTTCRQQQEKPLSAVTPAYAPLASSHAAATPPQRTHAYPLVARLPVSTTDASWFTPPVCLRACLSCLALLACLPACLLAACLPVLPCLPACLPACASCPACLPACLQVPV